MLLASENRCSFLKYLEKKIIFEVVVKNVCCRPSVRAYSRLFQNVSSRFVNKVTQKKKKLSKHALHYVMTSLIRKGSIFTADLIKPMCSFLKQRNT